MPQYDFNPPPGWPEPPKGWRPPPGWQPDPSWPPPPPGWGFWRVRPPSKAARRAVAILGGVSALALLATGAVVVVRGSTSDRGIAVADEESVPRFATIAEATDYYEQQKTDLRGFIDENPFGYDYTFVEELLVDLDDSVRDESTDLFPDPHVIARAGIQVLETQGRFARLVEKWETDFAPKPDLLANTTGSVAEAALDAVSAGVSDIRFDDFCGTTDEALACVATGTLVHVPSELLDYDDERMRAEFGDHWSSVMWHEFAHVIQNKYLFRLWDDPDFQRLFVDPPAPPGNGDIDYPAEHSADCMAAAVLSDYIMGYDGECTPEKLDFARTVWDGSFYVD